MKTQTGLTLVELMVVVAVMAIIATVAYPLYTTQVEKARRAEAKVALESIAMAQERYFTLFGSYASQAQLDDPNGDGDTADSMITTVIEKLDHDGDGNPDNYALAIVSAADSFGVTATAQGAQADDGDCATFTIDQLGAKGATGDEPAKCW